MPIIEDLLAELEQEAQTTRRVLERVPQDHLGWKPHEKSMSLGQLAQHVANIPGTIAELSQQSPFQLPEFIQPAAESAAELVPALDASIARAREVLLQMTDEDLAKIWKAVDGDREVLAIPVRAMLRTIMLNHWYHHRGQLSVYLRQLGVPLPSIYGPSADDNPFAAAPFQRCLCLTVAGITPARRDDYGSCRVRVKTTAGQPLIAVPVNRMRAASRRLVSSPVHPLVMRMPKSRTHRGTARDTDHESAIGIP